MIVKNESHIIEKTLENLCQKIKFSYWVISDTGSTDNTVEIIEKFFKAKGINGEISHDPWLNFAHNRNKALEKCLGKSDYVFFFDADDFIYGEPEFPQELTEDFYYFKLGNGSGSSTYYRKLLVKNNNVFFWRGVVHEFIEYKENVKGDHILGDYYILSGRTGDRNKDPVKKYLNDAKVLEEACINNLEPDLLTRYMFYCAQSYRDAGVTDKAIEWYEKRANHLDGWIDERYISYLNLGYIYEDQNNHNLAILKWQEAASLCPERAEAWYNIARRYNWNKNYQLAYIYAKQAHNCSSPNENRLFLNENIYKFWGHYEYCINSFSLNKLNEAYEGFKMMLEFAPADLIKRVIYQIDSYGLLIEEDTFKNIKNMIINLIDKGFEDEANKLLAS